ncbi:MAG: zinc-ribbon domain-containing protein [Dehalococcoidia bacterium]|nr:zinc-ribbon domain-containing protein [Dehalococcoidia bacterium]
MYCSRCGKEASDEWNVCPQCGAQLRPSSATGLPNGATGAPPQYGIAGRS